MFTKLPLIFNTVDVDWHQFKSDFCFQKYYSPARQGGSYFYIIKDYSSFKELLKKVQGSMSRNFLRRLNPKAFDY